jgi:integrase
MVGPHLIAIEGGCRLNSRLPRLRFDEVRIRAAAKAKVNLEEQLAVAIRQIQLRDISHKAASAIADIREASALLGHSDKRITEAVYRRVGEVVKPTR